MAIDKAKAQAALDDAFAKAVDRLFGVVAAKVNAREDDAGAQALFATGLQSYRRAHALAAAEIDRAFEA